MPTIVNKKQLKKWLCMKSLYEFVKEFWDSYETSPFSDCWLIEYLCECYQYSIKHFLPRYVWDEWISDEEYDAIKKKTGGKCDVRDHLLPNGEHTRNHDLNIAPRHMKLLADNTPVLTTNGWKNHGDLKVGDKLFNSRGEIVSVIYVHPKDIADTLITFSNGEKIKCNGKHLWNVFDAYNEGKEKTVETDWLKDKLHINEKMIGRRGHGYRFHLRNRNAIRGVTKNLPVDPYVLGAWLGDGNTNHQMITAGIMDTEVIDCVKNVYKLKHEWHNDGGWGKSIQYEFEKRMREDFNKIGLCHPKDKNNKHIPEEYLTASLEQRLELLAGLIDTDGSLVSSENRYFYITTSERLRDDVISLISTFGWKTSVNVQKADDVSKKDGYYIGFNPTFEIPCRIPRKQLKEFSKQRRISITSIEPLEIAERGNCITVEGGEYLVGRTLVQTHNSSIMNVLGPAWTIINTPVTVTSVSHSLNLSGEMVAKKQKLFNSEKYKYYFDEDINRRLAKNSSTMLELRNGGKTYSVAMDHFTGFGSDIIINDDLISVADARMNGAVLLHARDYYKTTMPSRLNNKTTGVIWHIMQRIGQGDISDLIAEDKGLRLIYSHTEIQAVASHAQTFIYPCSGKVKEIKVGDLLWTERFGDYTQLKMELGSEDFETQYNQNPSESKLNVIKEHMIHWIDDEELKEFKELSEFHYGSHDCPVKDKETSDYHGFCEGFSKDNELIITDASEEHLGYVAEKQLFTNLQIVDPSVIQIVEDKANGAALIQDLSKDVPGLVAFNPGTRSKTQRLELASTYMEQGLVRFAKTERNEYLVQQLKKFPLIEHDDITDAFSQLVIYHFTQRQLGVYTGAFSFQNIISPGDINIEKFLTYGATINGEVIKVIALQQNNFLDEYTVVEEKMFRSLEAFEKFCREDILPGNIVLDCSPQNRLSSITTNIYNISKFDDRERDKSINILKSGFYKKKVKILRTCKQTINDVARLRFTESGREKGVDQTTTLDEGMAGCLRGLITYIKGYSQQWF